MSNVKNNPLVSSMHRPRVPQAYIAARGDPARYDVGCHTCRVRVQRFDDPQVAQNWADHHRCIPVGHHA